MTAAGSSAPSSAVIPPLPQNGPLATPPSIAQSIRAQPWRGGLEPCGDVETYVLGPQDIQGRIPPHLNVSVARIGPGRIRIGQSKYQHWFDGDGQMTMIHLNGACQTAVVTSRLVQTDRVLKQQAKWDADAHTGRLDEWVEGIQSAPASKASSAIMARGAWTQSDGGSLLANLFTLPTNPANTSAVWWAGKLLALCEGGMPVELDADTLRTKGEVDFGLKSRGALAFSAHYKVDAAEGVLYNFGLAAPPATAISLFALDSNGTVLRTGSFALPPGQQQLVHDCAMSQKYLCFVVDPWSISSTQSWLQALVGTSSFGGSFKWDTDKRTRIVVIRKADLSVACDLEVDAFSSYHFSNAWDEGQGAQQRLHVHVARHIGARTPIERNFADMYSANWKAENYNQLWEMVIDPVAGTVDAFAPVSTAMLPMEFPKVATPRVGLKARYVYTSAFSDRPGCQYFDALQRLDTLTGEVQVRLCAPFTYPAEVEFVPMPGAADPEQGYLVYLEYDAALHCSTVVILDAMDIEGAALCRLPLPHHVPYTFHGCVFQRP